MKNIKKRLFLSGLPMVLLSTFMNNVTAQELGIKTNLLYDATSTINLGVEMGLHARWSLDISANYNGWMTGEKLRLKHWLLQPEARYWLAERFNGHFLGLHAHVAGVDMGGTKFPIIEGKGRYKGYLYGAGISYGYQVILGERLGLEGTIGFGYARIDYDRFSCKTCTDKSGPYHKNYIGPTKFGITLIYFIK